MYYSITKRIVRAAFGYIILIAGVVTIILVMFMMIIMMIIKIIVILFAAFSFAFFIIHFNNETESFDDIFRSFLKVIVHTILCSYRVIKKDCHEEIFLWRT